MTGFLRSIIPPLLLLATVPTSARAQTDSRNALSTPLPAQESSGAIDSPSATGAVSRQFQVQHHFWDRENMWLFAGVGVARALDYTSTLNMRRRGRQEILLTNSVVDNHPLFAGIEVGGTALSVGASYLLHRTGHHRLERWVSVVHIGAATIGDIRNYSLQTAHPALTTAPSGAAGRIR